MKINTTKQTEELIKSCSTKSILESDLNHLEIQKKQINKNIELVKAALEKPESEGDEK